MQTKLRTICCLSIVWMLNSCNAQQPATDTPVGGAFENSEYTFLGMPKEIHAVDTSAGWKEDGQQLMITGVVYQPDGQTPAADVLLYYYQTNTAGRYVHRPEEPRSMPPNELGQTHGYIRGWVKTDRQGRYTIYTVRPAPYPTGDEPAHIHLTVKEPRNIPEYYLDDFVFDDDKILNSARRHRLENRGGSGILHLVQQNNLWIGQRNIILGLNIPDHPGRR